MGLLKKVLLLLFIIHRASPSPRSNCSGAPHNSQKSCKMNSSAESDVASAELSEPVVFYSVDCIKWGASMGLFSGISAGSAKSTDSATVLSDRGPSL